MNSFYSKDELAHIGFKSLGTQNVMISRKACIYGAENISIGNNVRIDDFCILSGNIIIGNHVHLAAYVSLFAGSSGIILKDFVGISSRTAVYAESDDYTGIALTNPTIPKKYRNIIVGKVIFEKHSLVGTGCTVLPNVTVGEGASIGAMSLINKSIEPWTISIGIPCKVVRYRSHDLLKLENEFLQNSKGNIQCSTN